MNFAATDTFKSSISLYEFWRIFLGARSSNYSFGIFRLLWNLKFQKFILKKIFNEIFFTPEKNFFQKNSPKIFFKKINF